MDNQKAISEIKELLNIKDFEKRFETFVALCQKMIDDDGLFSGNVLEVDPGRKYIRIWSRRKGESSGRSAWCFVDKTTGDILKPATWRAPAKHARGNIFNEDNGMTNMQVTGPAYLR